jgi:hypothetical protein
MLALIVAMVPFAFGQRTKKLCHLIDDTVV